MFIIQIVYWLYIFLQTVDFYYYQDCLIHGTTSNRAVWITYNIINKQPKYYFGSIRNGQGFCCGRDEEKCKGFALKKTGRDPIMGWEYRLSNRQGFISPLLSIHP